MRNPFIPTLAALTLLAGVSRAAESVVTNYNFWCSAGSPQATAWYDDKVCVMIEAELPSDRDAARMDQIVQVFNDVYTEFEAITGLTNLPKSGGWQGRIVIQVPLDNCGAGGLANHGSLGVSVGVGLFEQQYAKITENKFLQVWFYEINRNFWPPHFNDKFDWAMDDNPSNWGWWTVGMNNAQAYMMAEMVGVTLEYFGSGPQSWYDGMVGDFTPYVNDPQYDFDYGWKQSLMPWNPVQSINNLMTGFILTSYTDWGGRAWLEEFYQWIQSPEVPDRSDTFAFQECRDNVYRVWSMAANQDLIDYFEQALRWEISCDAESWVRERMGQAPLVCPDLTANVESVSASAGGSQSLSFDGSPSLGFRFYLVLGSASGTLPGSTVDGIAVPLNFDTWTTYTLANANGPVYQSTFGLIDVLGSASATIVVPQNTTAAAVGLTFEHALLVFEPNTNAVIYSSNAVSLTIET